MQIWVKEKEISITFCFGPFEIWQLRNNCSGIKTDWGYHFGCSYLRNAYYVITFCCFTHVLVDSAYKQLTMVLSQARNLLRPKKNLPAGGTPETHTLREQVGVLQYLNVWFR